MKYPGIKLDAYSYDSLIGATAKSKDTEACVAMLEEMKREGIQPRISTFLTILTELAEKGEVDVCLQMYSPSLPLLPLSFHAWILEEMKRGDTVTN
jgi:pentatricopeptide repeat protein